MEDEESENGAELSESENEVGWRRGSECVDGEKG